MVQVPVRQLPHTRTEEPDGGPRHQENLQRQVRPGGEGDAHLPAGRAGPPGPGGVQHQQVPGLLRGGGQQAPQQVLPHGARDDPPRDGGVPPPEACGALPPLPTPHPGARRETEEGESCRSLYQPLSPLSAVLVLKLPVRDPPQGPVQLLPEETGEGGLQQEVGLLPDGSRAGRSRLFPETQVLYILCAVCCMLYMLYYSGAAGRTPPPPPGVAPRGTAAAGRP